jgi:hypothetical protein
MKVRIIYFHAVMAITSVGMSQNTKDWMSLFDGKSTANWTPRAEVELFEAENGELHLFSKRNVWVISKQKMKNFEVECEVIIPQDYQGFNSGLGFRLSGGDGKPKGYQCEIDRAKPAGIYGIGMGGWLYPNKSLQAEYQKRTQGLFIADQWNHFRVICHGQKVQTYLNGKLVADTNGLQDISGHFGIQHHGKGGTVRFRNLRARDHIHQAAKP